MNLNDALQEAPEETWSTTPSLDRKSASSGDIAEMPTSEIERSEVDDKDRSEPEGVLNVKKTGRTAKAPAAKPGPSQKPESCKSPFQAKRINLPIRKLPDLSAPLTSLAKFRAEHAYIAKLTSALHAKAIQIALLLFPIILATTDGGQRVVAGSRTWAISKAALHPDTEVSAIDIGSIDKLTTRMLAVVDSFICGLYFCLTRGAMKALQDAYSILDDESQEVAKQLLPGATTKKELSDLTGIREATTYDRRAPNADLPEQPVAS